MRRTMKKAVAVAGLSVASLLGASPAAACARTHKITFEPGSTQVADSGPIADFLQVPSYGARQRIIVSVSGPDGDLGRRRAQSLADLLRSLGLDPRGIMIESHAGSSER